MSCLHAEEGGGISMKYLSDFGIITFKGKSEHENVMFYSSSKAVDQLTLPGK